MANNDTPLSFSQRAKDEIFYPNDVRLDRVIIKNGVFEIDISALVVQINIFEDVYSNTLSGSITLADSINLIGTFPFVGLEQIQIGFKTPGFSKRDKTELLFDVYQIADRNTGSSAEGSDVTQVYSLHLISPAFARNQKSRVLKAFSHMSIDEMVGRIINNFLSEDVETEFTSGTQSYVIPGWTPFRAVNWLAARARPEKNPAAANYLFYETCAGYQFRSIDSLVQQKPVARFVYDPANTRLTKTSGDAAERLILPELQLMRSYTIMQSGSMMERIDRGMYASKLITHDIVTKQFSTSTFNYVEDFPKQNHIEDFIAGQNLDQSPQDSKPFPGGQRHGQNHDSVIKFHPKHTALYDGVPDYDESEKWLLQRMSHMRQIESMRVKIEIPGLNFLSAGETVVLEVPRPENVDGREHPDDRDPEVSGNYLITNIHHILSFTDHHMVVELSKESLPASSNQDRADIANAVSSSETFGGTTVLERLA